MSSLSVIYIAKIYIFMNKSRDIYHIYQLVVSQVGLYEIRRKGKVIGRGEDMARESHG